ncbi:MAG: AAA family ATPase [Planctomycetes bacterium]|nr:AAA family ATPase [Planctomycetota bacterium]
MFTIAVAGKGGVGKTTVAALIIETLKRDNKAPILAVDADPNATLGDWLGIKYQKTVSDIIEETKGLRNLPDGVSKPQHLEYQLQQVITESKGVDLLVMGHPEGPDCYCMANNILRGYVAQIVKNYKYVVIDNEAGMEHLNRKTTQNIDVLLLVSDATRIGLQTAGRIKALIDKLTFLNIKKKYLLINKVSDDVKPDTSRINLPLAGVLPLSDEICRLESDGKNIPVLSVNSPLLSQVRTILSRVFAVTAK